MANMTAAFAQLERRLISGGTKAALAVKNAQAVRLGHPPTLEEKVRRQQCCDRAVGKTMAATATSLTHPASRLPMPGGAVDPAN
jgi:DNA invertase Pin-like site-specific DNA recombinase